MTIEHKSYCNLWPGRTAAPDISRSLLHVVCNCGAVESVELLRRLHANEHKRRLWSWVSENHDIARHRGVVAAIKTRRAGWMIVDVDNLNRDYETEYFVEGDFPTEGQANERRDELVRTTYTSGSAQWLKYTESSARYLAVRPGNTRLYVFDGY